MTETVRVEVLGPLRLVVDGAEVVVRGPLRRAALAMLALAQGRAVTVDGLLDALWPDQVPDSGRAALHSHVSRLRRQLGSAAERLQTLDGGYRLVLRDQELDVGCARALLASARATAGRDPARAVSLLAEARALWRGRALAELIDVRPLAAAAVELDQLQRDVTDLYVACSIEAGRAPEVVGLAAAQSAAEPLREPAVLLHVRALAAAGQAPEALRVAREFRRRLTAETGLDPTPSLDELEREVAAGVAASVPVAKRPPQGTVSPWPAAPPATSPQAAHSWAHPASPLMGRDGYVTAVLRLIGDERLVTIAGPGGVGKTRVALEVARRAAPDRPVTVLRLAAVTDPGAVVHALAAALGLHIRQGDLLAACTAWLRDGPALLVVDNCEHLLDAARDVVAILLADCPHLTVLATSREPLGLPVECTSRLAPLPLPPVGCDRAGLERAPSVAVFLHRAARVRAGFTPDTAELDTIAEIVRRLDGVPLAIELAAGRLSTFSVRELAERLDRALDLLGDGRPAGEVRHRTLRATLSWSYDLLAPEEQRLFRNLAVFVDGADLPTVEAVAAGQGSTQDPGSLLARLVDASVVDVSFEEATRYRMLETVRAFALDRLAAAGEQAAADERLVDWAVRLATWIDAAAATEHEQQADAALRRELGNLRAAWRTARCAGAIDEAVTLVTALNNVTSWRDLHEMWTWADEIATDPALQDHPRRGVVLGCAARNAYDRGEHVRADELARAGLALVGDDREGRWYCLDALSLAALTRADYTTVIAHSLAAADAATRPRESLGIAALAATYAGELDQARDLQGRMRAQALSPTMRAFAAYVAGEIEATDGAPDAAERHYQQAIELSRLSGATFITGISTLGLLTTRTRAGHVRNALLGYRDVIDYWAHTGNWTQQWVTLRNLAGLLRDLDDAEAADLLDAAADEAPDAPPGPVPPSARTTPCVDRSRALQVAREAIAAQLTGDEKRPPAGGEGGR